MPDTCVLVAEGFCNTLPILERLLKVIFQKVDVVYTPDLPEYNFRAAYVLFVRVAHPSNRWIAEYFVERNIAFDYFIDDNFFELKRSVDPDNGPMFDHQATHQSITTFIENARTTIVMSRRFKEYILQRCPRANVQYVPAPVDIDLFERVRHTNQSLTSTEEFRVGYVVTVRQWLAPFITQIIEQSEARFGTRVMFEFVGWWPQQIAGRANVRTFEAIWNYEKCIEFMHQRRWSVGLAALGDSVFENSKTNNKYREYGAALIPAIYSDVPLYQACISDGVTGWLVPNNPSLWVDKLASLVDDNESCKTVAAAAYTDVVQHHAQRSVADAFYAAITGTRAE